VDKSEVTGDRLKEAQFINKSLSALGDVIFDLAQKKCSCHIETTS
jgi:kinesin family protein C2/C3